MSFLIDTRSTGFDVARRRFLGVSGLALSGTAVALLAGRDSLAAGEKTGNPANDVGILNSAIAAEHEAVAAYAVGAGSGLLKGPVLALATTFQGHHKQHVDVLVGTVRKLGGAPSEAKASYSFPVETLKIEGYPRGSAGVLASVKGAHGKGLYVERHFGKLDVGVAALRFKGDGVTVLATAGVSW